MIPALVRQQRRIVWGDDGAMCTSLPFSAGYLCIDYISWDKTVLVVMAHRDFEGRLQENNWQRSRSTEFLCLWCPMCCYLCVVCAAKVSYSSYPCPLGHLCWIKTIHNTSQKGNFLVINMNVGTVVCFEEMITSVPHQKKTFLTNVQGAVCKKF